MAKVYKYMFYYVIIVILFPYSCVSNEYSCVQTTQCLCEFKNNNLLNITHIESNFTQGNITYSFSGCNKNSSLSGCEKGKFCKYDTIAKKGTLLGTNFNFTPFGEERGAYNIVFSDTNSTITLVCTQDFNYNVFTEHQGLNNSYYLFSSHACVLSRPVISDGLSTGSVLIILFLLGGLMYFVGGAIVLHCIRGARGKEMIPNIDFWQDLPNLVKDGLIFALNGCRPTAIATADSYDRI